MPLLVPADAPDFVRTVTARIFAGLGDQVPVSAIPADGTFPSGTAAFEKRNISDSVPVWREDLCVQCGQCSFVCPHSVIRAKYYNEDKLEGGAGQFQIGAGQRARLSGSALHVAVLCRGLHGVRPVRRGLPGDQPARGRRQGDQHGGQAAAVDRGARQHRVLRNPAGERSRAGGFRRCARRAVPGAAVRVFRRLRRLRRDAVSQAAQPVVRRSGADRQCHRLLLDLRRQPAGHALDKERRRPRAGLVELAVRGQRRVRSWLPSRGRQASGDRVVVAGRSRG